MSLLNRSKTKQYIRTFRPDARISAQFLDALEAHIRLKVEMQLSLPANRTGTIKDFMHSNGLTRPQERR